MRSYIALDLQQIFYHVKRQKKRINFEKLYDSLMEDADENDVPWAYLTTSPHTESSYLINNLKEVGFDIKMQEQIKERKQLKFATRSVGMTIDLIEQFDMYDRVILVSIDQNLTALCDYLRDNGKEVIIMTFKKFESEFKPYVNEVRIITEDFFITK